MSIRRIALATTVAGVAAPVAFSVPRPGPGRQASGTALDAPDPFLPGTGGNAALDNSADSSLAGTQLRAMDITHRGHRAVVSFDADLSGPMAYVLIGG